MGSPLCTRTVSGRVEIHSTANNQVGGSIPGRPTASRADRPVSYAVPDPSSKTSKHKLLTPPPPNSDIQFQGKTLGVRFLGPKKGPSRRPSDGGWLVTNGGWLVNSSQLAANRQWWASNCRHVAWACNSPGRFRSLTKRKKETVGAFKERRTHWPTPRARLVPAAGLGPHRSETLPQRPAALRSTPSVQPPPCLKSLHQQTSHRNRRQQPTQPTHRYRQPARRLEARGSSRRSPVAGTGDAP